MAGLLDDLDIVNAACAAIGEDPLGSMDDEIEAGQAASLLYTATLEFCLGIHNFSFSKEVRQLSRDDTATANAGYTLVYTLPAERIGDPLYLTDDATDPSRRFSKYALVGNRAHSDAEELWAMIRYRASPHRWTGPFKMLMIKAMASELAIPIAHDRQLADQLKVLAFGSPQDNWRGGLMRAAISAEAFTQPPRSQNRDDNPLTAAWRS